MPPPPFKEGGAYAKQYVGRCVGSLTIMQLITQVRFVLNASNLVDR